MSIDIEATYGRYGPMVLRRCRSLLRDEERAVDAMHDTFVRLLRGRDRLTDDGLSSLLWRVATNVCLNQLRTQRRRPEDPDDQVLLEIADLDGTEDRTLASRVLEAVFDREPADTRTMAVLCSLAAPEAYAADAEPTSVRRFALIAAANDGGADRTQLRYAESDAQTLAAVLRQLGGVAAEDESVLVRPSPADLELRRRAAQESIW